MYASRLENLLNQEPKLLPGAPRTVEVLCMGVNGWGPQHELAYVQEFGFFQANLVMVMGPPADAYRPRYGIEQFPFSAEGHRPAFAWEEFWEHLRWEYEQRFALKIPNFDPYTQPDQVLFEGVHAWWSIALMARKQDAQVDFDFLPNEDEAREGRASESTQRVLDALLPDLPEMKVSAAYPLSFFRSNVGMANLYHDGAHLGLAGHRIYASYLCDRILQVALSKQ
jgi:hypothetical protein